VEMIYSEQMIMREKVGDLKAVHYLSTKLKESESTFYIRLFILIVFLS